MLAANTVLKELDLSDNRGSGATDGPGFAQELAVGFRDNEALSVTNVMGNKIGKEQLAKLQEIMRSKPNLVSLCGVADDATEADLSGLGMDADDAAILASELPDKGALSMLSLKNNRLATKEAGMALATALAANSVLKELDLSSNAWTNPLNGVQLGGVGFAQQLANGIKDNGAISSLNLANNDIGQLVPPEGWRAEYDDGAAPWIHTDGQRVEDGMPEGSMPVGVIALANVIPDMRAMTSLNLASNYLGSRGAKIVAEAIKVIKCTPAISMAPVFSINCCCLLLSAGYGGTVLSGPLQKQHWHRWCCIHHRCAEDSRN
jgi:hypothetical protein